MKNSTFLRNLWLWVLLLVAGSVSAQVTTQEELNDAISAASAGSTVEITAAGTYKVPKISNNITVKGTVDGVVFDCVGSGSIASIPNGCTFENVTFNMGQSNYHGFQGAGTINMKNCITNGLFFSYGNMNFEECEMNQSDYEYIMWLYSGDVTFTNCECNGQGKIFNVYNEGNGPHSVSAKGCTFNSTQAKKAAFNIKETCGAKELVYSVVISDCKAEGSFPSASETDALIVGEGGLWQVDDRNANSTANGGISMAVGKDIVVDDNGKIVSGSLDAAYGTKIEEKLISEESTMTPNADGTYIVAPASAAPTGVAQIGSTSYETLVEAIVAAPADGTATTIKMLDDVDLAAALTVAAGKNITIDLNGKTIKNEASKVLAQLITVNGQLTIDDSSADKAGKIQNTASGKYVVKTGTAASALTLKNGTIETTAGNSNGAVYGNSGAFVMTGGKVIAAGTGVTSKNVNISGGEIAATAGQALCAAGTITGGKFTSTNNNAVYANQSGTLEITGGEFTGVSTKPTINIYNTDVKVTGATLNNGVGFTSNATAMLLAGTDATNLTATQAEYYDGETLVGYAPINTGLLASSKVSGKTVKLTKDVATTTYLNVTKSFTLDLNGHNITCTPAKADATILSKGTASAPVVLTITGEGKISCGDHGEGCNAIQVSNYSTVNIEGGEFEVPGDNTAIYMLATAANSAVNISGGEFKSGDGKYVLNIKDDVRAYNSLNVTGGSFTGFNPKDNIAEGENTNFVAEGYCVSESAGVYTVGECNHVAAIGEVHYATLADALAAVNDGETIVVLADNKMESSKTIENIVVTIDLNGKTVETVEDAIVVKGTANVTIKNGTINHNDPWEPIWMKGNNDLKSSVTLDNVTINSKVYALYCSEASGTVIIKNSTLVSKTDGVVYYGAGRENGSITIINSTLDNTASNKTAALQTTGKTTLTNVVIKSKSNNCAIANYEYTELLIDGENTYIEAGECISTNAKRTNVKSITINGGTFKSTDDIAIYHQNQCPLTITDGVFEGKTALFVKNGVINISGGEFKANGVANEWATEGNGASSTGDAVVIEASNYYDTDQPITNYDRTNPSVSITGGLFYSENAAPVGYYTTEGNSEDHNGKMISGGLFSTKEPIAELIAEGYKVVDNPDTETNAVYPFMIGEVTYVAQIGETKYTTLAAAVAAVPADGTETTIVMINNEKIDITGSAITIKATQNIILDLNGYQVVGSATGNSASNLITNNGTLTIMDSSDTNADGTGTGKLITGATDAWVWDGTDDYSGSYASNLISNNNKLTILSGYYENISKGSAAYVIDAYANGAEPTVNIVGGALMHNNNYAVRMFCNDTKDNVMNVSGGSITGTRAIWIQLPGSTGSQKATLNVTGGTLTGTAGFALYSYSYGSNRDNANINISGGTWNGNVAFGGGTNYNPNTEENISITGGQFGGDNIYSYVARQNNGFITGGIFNYGSAYYGQNYLKEGYYIIYNTDPATMEAYPYTVGMNEYIINDVIGETPVLAENVHAVKVTYNREATYKWGTVCVPIPLKSNGYVQFYKIESIEGNILNLTETDNVFAGEPAVFEIKFKNEKDNFYFSQSVEAESGFVPLLYTPNTLYSNTSDITFRGTYLAKTLGEKDYENTDVFYIAQDKFWKSRNGKLKVKAFTAYFTTPIGCSLSNSFTIAVSDELTGTDAVTDEGEVTIVAIYDVAGNKYNELQKGLNIVKYSNGETQKINVK